MGVAGRFLLSVGFCAAIIGLFMLYERRGVLDRDARHIFNAAYLGLSLVLGLNLVSSFKAMADIFRWKVLASGRHGGHTAKELDLILGMNSYQKCTVLLWHWIKKPLYFSLLFGWIILGIVSPRKMARNGFIGTNIFGSQGIQLSVALLGLTYNHESEDAQRTSPGLVNATDIRWFYSPPRVDGGDNHIPSFLEQNHRSHVFGEGKFSLSVLTGGGFN